MSRDVRSPMILAEGLEKHFGTTHALRGLDLDVAEGTILALLGPNGAGKTTAVRILTTLLKPDAGRAEVGGIDVLSHTRPRSPGHAAPGSSGEGHAWCRPDRHWDNDLVAGDGSIGPHVHGEVLIPARDVTGSTAWSQ